MTEKWTLSNNIGNSFGSLSKVFDCRSNKLIVAKFSVYGFMKINIFYSAWQDILSGVSQCSVLAPLLFNTFLCNLFLTIKNTHFASYIDDDTPYTTAENIDDAIWYIGGNGKSSDGLQKIR